MGLEKQREGVLVQPELRLSDEQIRLMDGRLFKADFFNQNDFEAIIGGSASFE